MPFETVRYAYDASDDSSVSFDMTEAPDLYVVVGEHAYFADSSGYMMVCPIETIEAFVVDIDGNVRYQAINAKWFDESDYGALVPVEMIRHNEAVATALSVLHESRRLSGLSE